MDNKEYLLVVSTLDIDPSTFNPINDPLNIKFFSAPLSITAKNENEAISKFIETDFFNQYHNEHYSSTLFFYCKGENEPLYHKVNDILLDMD